METIINYLNKKKDVYEYLIGINLLIFIIVLLIDANFSTKTIINFGAKVNYLIADGEYYRIITAIFLHLSFYHIAFNCFALYILGKDLEKIFGKKKFLYIYFFSGITSSLLSFFMNNSISAGASGAIFGLLGCHVFLYFTFKEIYKRTYGNSFLVLIGINLVFGFIHPNIDNAGHIGGLIGGIIISFVLNIKKSPWSTRKKLLSFIIIPIITLSIGYKLIENYKFSIDYYLYKTVTLIKTENYNEAFSTALEGEKKYPNIADFKYLIKELNKIQ